MKNILSEFNLKLKDGKLCIKSIVYYVEDETKYVDVVFANKGKCLISSFDYEVKCKDEEQNEIISIPNTFSEQLDVGEESSVVTIKLPKTTEHGEINFDSCVVEGDIKAKATGTYCFTSDENIS